MLTTAVSEDTLLFIEDELGWTASDIESVDEWDLPAEVLDELHGHSWQQIAEDDFVEEVCDICFDEWADYEAMTSDAMAARYSRGAW